MTDLKESIDENNNLESDCNPYFDTISVEKVIFLSIFTLGLYEIVWFYKTWKAFSYKLDYKISPFWRAIFSGLWCFSLFPRLEQYIKKFEIKAFPGIVFAILYCLINLTWKLPNSLWLICYSSVIVIAIIQNKINEVNKQYFLNATINHWNGTNTLCAIIGGVLFVMTVIGTFMSE